MATTQVVLGLLVREAADRSAILRRYGERPFDRDLMLPMARRPRLQCDEHGELRLIAQRDAVGTPESKLDAALVWLQEHGLTAATAVGRDPKRSQAQEEVYIATSAGRAHFEWWLGDASTLDPAGDELWQKLMFSDKQHASRLIELIRSQELLCLERLEELRCSIERMTFARCSRLEELWDAMTADDEPAHMQCTIATMQKVRLMLGDTGEEVNEARRSAE
jgi:hypothetical protein